MPYEMKEQLRPGDTLTVVTRDPKYHFVPSNPWVAVSWRKPADIEIDLGPVLEPPLHARGFLRWVRLPTAKERRDGKEQGSQLAGS